MVSLLAEAFLKKNPGAKIVCEPRALFATVDIVEKLGGKYIISRSGHTYMKAVLREENAICEMASHHYFRDFYYCDSGMITWLLILELLSQSGKKLSEIMADRIKDFPVSGEINTKVDSTDTVKKIMAKVEKIYAPKGKVNKIDGLSVDFENSKLNLISD